jgi:pyridoxal phosphate enzyme (YggS family)
MKTSAEQKLRANLAAVEERIANACVRAGRTRSEVTVVAVTKTVSAELAALLPEVGILDLGENRPQELWRKSEVVGAGLSQRLHAIRWHLIGHLQRNKIDRTLPLVEMIHAVDSVRLLQAVEQEATRQGRRIAVLLEVNASGEASKQGFDSSDVWGLVPILTDLKQVQVRGLMTMAALQEPQACRPTFAALRQLRDQLGAQVAERHSIAHLSMGMSNDFEVAIEEGATFVRLGTVLFEGMT